MSSKTGSTRDGNMSHASDQFGSAIEQSWYHARWWTWLLLPLSLLFAGISALRRLCFRLGLAKATQVTAPVIVVGNISVGGTGKTPFTLWLCQYLQQQGLKPGILSRGYGAKIKHPQLVSAQMSAADVGDEPLLLAQLTGVPVVVCPKRVSGAQFLLANTDCNIVICDDGLQHYALARDLEIVLIDGLRGLGNGWLLPAGPLREGAWRLASVDLVLSNSAPSSWTPFQLDVIAAPAKALVEGSTLLAPKSSVALVSGIGNPERFATTAQQAGFFINSKHYFPDHHPFAVDDFQKIPTPLLMTAKDAVKCQPFAKPNWYYLPITAQVPAAAQQVLWQKLQQIRSRYGL